MGCGESTPEAGRRGLGDEEQLSWAADEGRVLVSFNAAHFVALHAAWMGRGGHHAGLVVSSQRPLGELIRRLTNLAQALEAESLRDRLEFLSDW